MIVTARWFGSNWLWWLICAMSYKRVFGAKNAKGHHAKTRQMVILWVFAWRPCAPPGKDTTNSSRKCNAWNVAYYRVAKRKVAMRKHEKVIIWRVFALRLFAFSPRKHDNTTWHKSATTNWLIWQLLYVLGTTCHTHLSWQCIANTLWKTQTIFLNYFWQDKVRPADMSIHLA